jgi:IclR family pca regulon transcriptional regulator
MGARYFVKSLARGLCILETIADSSQGLSLTEVASSLGLSKTTAFGFLFTLEQLDYLDRDPETKVYSPALKVLDLGFAYLNRKGILEIAQPYLRRLSEECGTTTDISVLDGVEIITLALEKVWRIVDIGTYVGTRLPAHCSASGKVQLMELERADLVELLGEGPYSSHGPNTITTLNALLDELDKSRQRGYAITDEELAPGLRSVAAPIRDRENRIVAAICSTAPTAVVSSEELETVLAPKVVHTARQISAALTVEASPQLLTTRD